MSGKLTPRQRRAIGLLIPGQWVGREVIDRVAEVANGPGLIFQIRRMVGHDAIESRQVEHIDRDGKPCRPGQYRAAPHALERLAKLMEQGAGNDPKL